MKELKSRAGSALLIVLGMMSFMVISGVAFSVFMRATRLPSSFTRRTVSTRQLAKAALAEAIDQIDRSIANDPHPNIRLNNANEYNHWLGRILFMPYLKEDSNGNKTLRHPADIISDVEADPENGGCTATVPVLTLEALAYLPPPLVNEVRYYGRRTPTAAWQSFDFDAGRYAFIAVDVSDYLDVNRVLAEEARSSNPARRINIAYLFEDGGEHNTAPAQTRSWETFLKLYTGRQPQADGAISYTDSSKPPFTSLADFNILLGCKKPCGFRSPFYEAFWHGGKGCDDFYQGGPGNGEWDKYSQMTFVMDSYAAPEEHAHGGTTFDLDDPDEEGQPFDTAYFERSYRERSFSDLADSQKANKPRQELAKNRISLAGLIALQDYLDYDDVPTSLAVPTTERVPMVCGVQPIADGIRVAVTYEISGKTQNTTAQQPYEEQTVKVSYKLDGPVTVDAWTAFPFRDRAGFENSFKADCRVALFLSKEEMGLRTVAPGNTDVLRAPTFRDRAALRDGVVNLFVSDQACSVKNVTKPDEAVSSAVGFSLGDISAAYSGNNADGSVILELTYQWPMKQDQDGNWVSQDPTPAICRVTSVAQSAYTPLLANGSLASPPTIATGTTLDQVDLSPFKAFCNLACWVSVRNADGDVVDLVPACMADDRAVNSVNNNDEYNEFFQQVAGYRAPLLKFAFKQQGGAADFTLVDAQKLCDGGNGDFTFELMHKNGIVVRDPRFNHAPENWFAAGSGIAPEYWLQNAGYGDSGCDGDIFMATSDQGYLQSIAELAFLPRFTNLKSVPSNQDYGDFIRNPENWSNSNRDYPAKGNEAQANMMWRTYDPFDNGDNADGFEELCENFHHHARGVRVNPYSDATNIVMAAFANTPVSWRVASGRDETDINTVRNDQKDAAEFNKKYAWCAYGDDTSEFAKHQLDWEDLSKVAGQFMSSVRANARTGDSWEVALQDLFTDHRNAGTTDLCGVPLSNSDAELYSVDKKMLWGFWQNSFEPQQQLFLVFFRAEPMMMGGGMAGVTPPQLGARGVALVWRNPNKTSNGTRGYASFQRNNNRLRADLDTSYAPHQTRVLFYKQFE